jgi:hypothetical protein
MTRSASSGTRRNERIRCAIYTRKSSEEGIEQEFNSLQAQRQAREAFINSQCHEGWVCLRAGYDDGGFSGATMDRDQPLWDAVQAQLADNAVERHSGARNRRPSVLAGMLFDGDGNHMTPSHAVKKSTRYRSYVSRPLIAKDQTQGFAGLRIPAGEIEQLVTSRLRQWLFDSAASTRRHGFPIPQHSAGSSREPPRSGRLGPSCPEYAGAPSLTP